MAKAKAKKFVLPIPKYKVGDFVVHLGKQRKVIAIIDNGLTWQYELKNLDNKDTYKIEEHNIK